MPGTKPVKIVSKTYKIRKIFGLILKYWPIPPNTPAIIRSDPERVNLLCWLSRTLLTSFQTK